MKELETIQQELDHFMTSEPESSVSGHKNFAQQFIDNKKVTL
jgi:hypothetical protein